MNNYIKNGIVQSKVLAQLQLQMHVLKKPRGLLAIADPDFTQNKKVHITWIDYNKNICDDLIKKSWTFWKTFIFPILINTQTLILILSICLRYLQYMTILTFYTIIIHNKLNFKVVDFVKFITVY